MSFLATGCGKDEISSHNKNLPPVTGKLSDLKGAGVVAPVDNNSAKKASAVP
jgi:hypothetical protein